MINQRPSGVVVLQQLDNVRVPEGVAVAADDRMGDPLRGVLPAIGLVVGCRPAKHAEAGFVIRPASVPRASVPFT